MIIRLFRAQYLLQYVLLFLFTALLWADAILFPDLLVTGQGFEGFPLIKKFVLSYPLLSVFVSILLLYTQALMLNAAAGEHRLVERNQLVLAALYVLIMSSQPEMVQPNMMLPVNLLLILALYIILKLYGEKESLSTLFDVGFLTGLATLFFFPAVAFLPFIVVSLLVFQMVRWREWLIPIVGFVTPFIFVTVWYFWFDQLPEKFDYFLTLFAFQIPSYHDASANMILIWGLFAVLVFFGFIKILRSASEGSVERRKKNRVVIFMFLFALASSFFSGQKLISHIYLEIIPVVIFLSSYISGVRKLFLTELIVAIIFVAIIAIKVLNFS
ncbi:MAG: DUF6427 family protein [Bacteroidales bacterium]|nr:DUF6427 family protein [Bacteroidales bacterium]